MSLSAKYWGPLVWKNLYIVAYSYPNTSNNEQQQQDVIDYYRASLRLLPCTECREHCEVFINEHPIKDAVINRDTLLRWVNSLENSVNSKLHLPGTPLEKRLAELNDNNPDIPKKPVYRPTVTSNYSVHSANKKVIHGASGGGYGIRKATGQKIWNKASCSSCKR